MGATMRADGAIDLTFLGTRGEIDIRTRTHRRHSSLLLRHGRHRVMIDCGADWLHRFEALAPTAILLTHAHPDHAFGLAGGAPCPVYATRATFARLADYPIEDKRPIAQRRPFRIGRLSFEAFSVIHSLRAPAVGYRISGGGNCIFYVPDIIAIRERTAALRSVQLYIGDGASILQPLVRRSHGALVGHTPIRTQLGWCEKEHVPAAIFTHCGTDIVGSDGRRTAARVKQLGQERGVDARIARDGQNIRMKRGRVVRIDDEAINPGLRDQAPLATR